MKSKPPQGVRGRPARGKMVKKEVSFESTLTMGQQYPNASRPAVDITKCISFQKFRYSGENRPGKKYQEKDFMELKLSDLHDRVVRVVIICTDAENRELIHPNGLVGKDCHDGIYDKEYAITKNPQEIKIPYLRTERIKTKKHESDNIQTVLETRARHLPSPYKERCLSQCNDKYTSTRKFDTTKVCLGVIVTIISHQGTVNGSLHAISHVVRNASEKTTLGILKLSQSSVSALKGGCIDIFTTEHGPEIEEGKYYVYVTFEDDRYGQWRSESISAVKSDILYKRIITYQVPPFVLCTDLQSSVKATLNLECPQSNQYCSMEFTYKPHTEFEISEEIIHKQIKRSFSTQDDIKPSPKRLKIGEGEKMYPSSTVRVNLQNKIRAKQDNFLETPKDESNGDVDAHQSEASDIIVGTRDPNTGESPFYVDLDRHQVQNANSGSFLDPNVSLIKSQGLQQIAHSSSETHQGIEVVAAGYSDVVPPDTTVWIYTTTGGIMTDSVTEADQGDRVIQLEKIPHQSSIDGNIPSREIVEYAKDSKKSDFRILSAQESAQVFSSLHNNTGISRIQMVDSNANESSSKTVQIAGFNSRITSPSTRQFVAPSNSLSNGAAADDTIRVVVPNKSQQTSPWEVASDDNNLASILFPPKVKPGQQKKKEPQSICDPHSNSKVTENIHGIDTKDALPSVSVSTSASQLKLPTGSSMDFDLSTIEVAKFANNFEINSIHSLELEVKSTSQSVGGKK